MNKKHALLMLACCVIPFVALFCPLLHLLMMKFMPHEHGTHERTQLGPSPRPLRNNEHD